MRNLRQIIKISKSSNAGSFYKELDVAFGNACRYFGIFLFADIPFVAPAKPYVNVLVAFLTPLLIFSQLLLTFCKVEVHELKPKSWHGWLLLFQTVSCLIVAVLLVCCPMEEVYREVFEGAMVCLICPTATAAAVITGKLVEAHPA